MSDLTLVIQPEQPLRVVITPAVQPLTLVMSPVVITIGGGGVTTSALLLESGDALLLESGDRILLEA